MEENIYEEAMKRLNEGVVKNNIDDSKYFIKDTLDDELDITGGNLSELNEIVFDNYHKITIEKKEYIYQNLVDIVKTYNLKLSKEDIINYLIFNFYSCLVELENGRIGRNVTCMEYLKIVGKLNPIKYIGEIHDSDKNFKLTVEVYNIYPRSKKIYNIIELYKKIEKIGVPVPWFSEDFEMKNNKVFLVEYMRTPDYKNMKRTELLDLMINILSILKIMNDKGILCDVYLSDVGIVNYEKENYTYLIKKFNISIGKDFPQYLMNFFIRFEEEKIISYIKNYKGNYIHDDILKLLLIEKRNSF